MSVKDRLVWFKGEVIPAAQAVVPVLSPTAQFGLNVFEGVRGYWSNDDNELYLFRLAEHLDRLDASCRLIGIVCPYTHDEIISAMHSVLQANKYRCDIAVRVTVFVDGEGSWSDSEPVGMFVAPIAKARCDIAAITGVRACVSTWERIDDRSLPPRVKAGANYINGRYAHLEAKAAGYDLPILLDRYGKVSEGAGSCIMMVRDGVLTTPPQTASILESITRETLLTLASELELPIQVRAIDRTELYLAEELFLCGSAAEITPIVSIDRFRVGAGVMGALTTSLLQRFQTTTDGTNSRHRNWLTPIWNEV